VVDDDAGMRELLELMLGAQGYRVTAASDGVHALESLGTDLPDLVALDLMMPRLDGIAFVAELRRRAFANGFLFWC